MDQVTVLARSVGFSMALAAMKTMKKAKRVSVIAKGTRARVAVFLGTKERTIGGLQKKDFTKSKTGRIVSKARSTLAKKNFQNSALKRWMDATKQARKVLQISGFCPIGGKTAQGKAL